ncbi:MAG: hypothetical protein HFJ75_09805 [Eggerthellaceae bacterium]|nr:hypothetical protein [Eggerthellaceae bacterium]
MSVFLTHHSALAFWRRYREYPHGGVTPVKIDGYPGGPPTRLEVQDAARRVLPAGSVAHVSVPGDTSRTNEPGVCRHRWRRATHRGSYVRVGADLYVSTPEMTFLQMAAVLPLEYLVELGYELCGSYCLSAQDGGRRSCVPLSTPGDLLRLASSARGHRGRPRALRAARYVLAGTASPRETQVCMLLTLPKMLGGYGLRSPEPNGAIVYDRGAFARNGSGHVRCDLLWREARLALEYESDEFHASEAAYKADSRRRNLLRSLGYDIITLTNDEVKDVLAMDRVASSIARSLGRRGGATCEAYEQRKHDLRRLLLSQTARAGAAHLPVIAEEGSVPLGRG